VTLFAIAATVRKGAISNTVLAFRPAIHPAFNGGVEN